MTQRVSTPIRVAVERGLLWATQTNRTLGNGEENFSAVVTGNKIMAIETVNLSTTVTQLRIRLYEEQSFTGGSPVELFNRNRRSGANPDFDVFNDVTATPVGDPVLDRTLFAMLEGAQLQNQSDDLFMVLQSNTTYLFSLKNEGGQPGDYNVDVLYSRNL